MSGGRRVLHLRREPDAGPPGRPGDSSLLLPIPESGAPVDWKPILEAIFEHDVTVIW